MFSAGLDSYAIKKLYHFKDEECLFLITGTEDNKQELELIMELFPAINLYSLPIVNFELENKIIPFRNHLMALIAAQYGNEIWFGFTAGDTTKDKDYVFKAQIEDILNYFSIDEEKVVYKAPYSISMPFKEMTKTQIVKRFLDDFSSDLLFSETRSCYSGNSIMECGVCRSCLRKFVAVSLNEIPDSNLHFQNDPVPKLKEFYYECLSKNRKNEIKEVEACCKKYGVTI